MLYWNFS